MDPTPANPAASFLGAVTQLTACRHQAELDGGLLDLLSCHAAGDGLRLFRCVGQPRHPRLLLSAELRDGVAIAAEGATAPLDELPLLSADPLFAAADEKGWAADDDVNRHAFAVAGDSGCIALVELRAAGRIRDSTLQTVQSLLGVYRNLALLLDSGQTDALTGLLNRKTYDASFHRAAALDGKTRADGADRRAQPSSRWLAVIDIDHFKRVNDQHGHLIGDELLLLFGRLMRNTFRYGDSLYRFGGEEFVVLLRAPDRLHARAALERFRATLKAQTFPQVGTITASVGFTQIREFDLPSNAFERADRAVYHAKQNGRDQVCCFEDLADAGLTESTERAGMVELF